MFGLLVGLSAGIFTWFSRKSLPAAILAGGSAFAGTVVLALMVKNALGVQ
jgi:type III secretory pathway component EscR